VQSALPLSLRLGEGDDFHSLFVNNSNDVTCYLSSVIYGDVVTFGFLGNASRLIYNPGGITTTYLSGVIIGWPFSRSVLMPAVRLREKNYLDGAFSIPTLQLTLYHVVLVLSFLLSLAFVRDMFMTTTLSVALRSFAYSYASCRYLYGITILVALQLLLCFLYSVFHFVSEMEVKQSLVSALCQRLMSITPFVHPSARSCCYDVCTIDVECRRICNSWVVVCTLMLQSALYLLSAITAVTYAAMTFSPTWQMEVKQPLVQRLIMSLALLSSSTVP
jgi:hypothetical protein